jgi:hypothetical protein
MNLSCNQHVRLEILKIEALKSQCYANYWANFAQSKTNLSREVYHGGASKEYRGEKLTDAELEKEAFNTALSHIKRLNEIQSEIQNVMVLY